MNTAYIVDGIRTPVGSFGGTLASVRTDDLAALGSKRAAQKKFRDRCERNYRCHSWLR
jgi:acetyl-CoA acyltransferase